MVARMRKLKAEVDQVFIDAEHWSRINPEQEPLNPDPDGSLAIIRANLARSLMREDSR